MSEPLNQTGFLYTPHYLDVGDLLDANYDITDPNAVGYIPPIQLFFGDLDNKISLSELIDLTQPDTSRAGIRTDYDRPDRTTILDAAQRAEGTLDGYLARRYTVPVRTATGTVPRDVYKYALDSFKYELYTAAKRMPSSVEINYQKVMTWLLNLSKGLVVIPELIPTDDGTIPAQYGGSGVIGTVATGVDIFGTRRFGPNSSRYNSESSRFNH